MPADGGIVTYPHLPMVPWFHGSVIVQGGGYGLPCCLGSNALRVYWPLGLMLHRSNGIWFQCSWGLMGLGSIGVWAYWPLGLMGFGSAG